MIINPWLNFSLLLRSNRPHRATRLHLACRSEGIVSFSTLYNKRDLRGIVCKGKVMVLCMVTDLEKKLCDYSTMHYKQYACYKFPSLSSNSPWPVYGVCKSQSTGDAYLRTLGPVFFWTCIYSSVEANLPKIRQV